MAIFDELKSIASTLREADKIEQYRQILDVQEKLLEMQNRITELETENRELKEKVKTKDSLVYDKSRNSYWTNEGDGPFCSRCWDVDKNTVRIKTGVNSPAFHTCPECKTQVQTDPSYRPPFTRMKPPTSYI